MPKTAATPLKKKHALVDRCDDISKEKGLSAREQEVLLLLAQHKTISDIENELIVANGTVKAHIRHIYQKLDIHSREELFEILDTQTCEKKQTANDEDCF